MLNDGKYTIIWKIGRTERRIAWVRAAEKDFLKFPSKVQSRMRDALLIAAEGIATPKKEVDLIKARLKRIKEMYR